MSLLLGKIVKNGEELYSFAESVEPNQIHLQALGTN